MKTVLGAALFAAFGLAAHAGESFELRSGVIVDPTRASIFLMARSGGIDEIDLESGRVVWRSDDADKPLASRKNVLIAQAASGDSVLRTVIFDRTVMRQTPIRSEIDLGPEVTAGVDDLLGVTFRTSGRIHGGHAYIAWTFTRHPQRVAPPPPGSPPRPDVSKGTVRIGLTSGTSEQLSPGDEPDLGLAALPNLDAGWVEPESMLSGPSLVDDVISMVKTRRLADSRAAVTLRRWKADGHERLPDLLIYEGEVRSRQLSADGRHIMFSRLSRNGAPGTGYIRTLFSMKDGSKVAELRARVSTAPFFVRGDLLVYETPPYGHLVGDAWVEETRRLRAVEWPTATLRWTAELRETVYRGSSPP